MNIPGYGCFRIYLSQWQRNMFAIHELARAYVPMQQKDLDRTTLLHLKTAFDFCHSHVMCLQVNIEIRLLHKLVLPFESHFISLWIAMALDLQAAHCICYSHSTGYLRLVHYGTHTKS